MVKKPTDEKLKERIKELEKELAERRHTGETFRENASMLENILEKAADGICVCHNIPRKPFVRFTHWNPQMTAITGYTMGEINKLGWYQTMYPDLEVQKWAIERMARMRAGNDILAEEWVITAKDGKKKSLSISTSIVKEEDGKVHVLAVMRDITERKRMEEVLRESEVRYRLLAENASDIIWTVDMNMQVTYISPSVTRLLGYTVEEAKSRTMEEAYTPASFETARRAFEEEMALENARQGDLHRSRILKLELTCKDGVVVPVEANFSFFRDAMGKPVGILSIARDITERKQVESKLMESEERYRKAIEHSNDGVALVRGGRHVYVNQKFLEIFGYDTTEEVIGKNHSITVHPDDLEMVVERNRARERGESVPSRYEFKGIRKDGTTIYIEVSVTQITFQGESVTLAYFRDITERKRLEEKLRTMSIMDDLTGVYNRRGFLTLFQQQVKVAERTKENLLFLYADLDHMKWINDTLGHQAGDKALVEAANILKETFRKSDIIGRTGGDEFAVLAFGSTDENPEVFITRLRDNIKTFNERGTLDYNISLSVGIVRYDPEKHSSLDELMARADQLMYEEKRNKQY